MQLILIFLLPCTYMYISIWCMALFLCALCKLTPPYSLTPFGMWENWGTSREPGQEPLAENSPLTFPLHGKWSSSIRSPFEQTSRNTSVLSRTRIDCRLVWRLEGDSLTARGWEGSVHLEVAQFLLHFEGANEQMRDQRKATSKQKRK